LSLNSGFGVLQFLPSNPAFAGNASRWATRLLPAKYCFISSLVKGEK